MGAHGEDTGEQPGFSAEATEVGGVGAGCVQDGKSPDSHGDGSQQLSSSPFARGRVRFPCPDLLETSRLMKPPSLRLQ